MNSRILKFVLPMLFLFQANAAHADGDKSAAPLRGMSERRAESADAFSNSSSILEFQSHKNLNWKNFVEFDARSDSDKVHGWKTEADEKSAADQQTTDLVLKKKERVGERHVWVDDTQKKPEIQRHVQPVNLSLDWVPSRVDPVNSGGFGTPDENGAPVPYRLNGHVDMERGSPWALHD